MPKRRKKVETKKSSRRKNFASRDVSTSVASPNASLEQSITSGYEVVWNDKSPITDHHNLTSGHLGLVMKSLQGKVGLIQKKEGHQLLELFKTLPHHSAPVIKHTGRSDNRLAVITSEARSELKDLAKRLQYYDDDEERGNSPGDSEGQSATTPSTGQCTRLANGNTATVGVAESDTDSMSCCDDSSPDHYQPIGSHLCGDVATTNLQGIGGVAQHGGNSGGMAQCSIHSKDKTQHTANSGGMAQHATSSGGMTQHSANMNHHTSNTGGVVQHAAAHRGGVAGQQLHPDDEELDKLFASVEMNTSCSYGNKEEDEQFWCSAAIELTNQEVVGIPQGRSHQQQGVELINTSTPCRPRATPINTSHLDCNDFVDMLLTGDDMDTVLNQS